MRGIHVHGMHVCDVAFFLGDSTKSCEGLAIYVLHMHPSSVVRPRPPEMFVPTCYMAVDGLLVALD